MSEHKRRTSAAPDTANGGGDKVPASTLVARPSHDISGENSVTRPRLKINAPRSSAADSESAERQIILEAANSNSPPKASKETSENRDTDNDNGNGGDSCEADDEETVGSGADIDAEGEDGSVSAEPILTGPAGGTSKESLQAQAPSSSTTSLPDSMATWQATAPVSNVGPLVAIADTY